MDVEFLLDPTDEIPVAVCAREPLTPELWDEAWPLIERHYRALGAWSGAPLEPDVDRYAAMQAYGSLRVFTARWHGRLVGYLAYMVHSGLHYSTLTFASEDVVWIDPEVRASRVASDLFSYAEECLREENVDRILQHCRVQDLPGVYRFLFRIGIGPFLRLLGYTPVDIVFCKRIT
jgi:GNAT superfamily N-acetyltransferase